MTSYLVVEVQIWLFLLLLVIVLAGLAAGAWFGWRKLKAREAAMRESITTAANEDSLAKRNRMLIRLDHELKNPLTALRTSAATIREVVRDGGTVADVEPAAKQVDVSSRRVARLLADLRKLADVETRVIEYSRVDLDRLIHQAVEDASTAPGAEDRMIVATVARAPWRLPDVAGEEDLLLTAILNLLGNALKYSSQAEVVELRANEQIIDNHRWVVVEVADTGSGIPLAEQEQVWDELSRGSRVRAVAGSGMGLSLVRAIVTRHGGSVQLFSQEGVGTSVRMVLPVLADAAEVTVPQLSDTVDRAAASSHPVQPVQNPDMRHAPGYLPPRQPSEAELQGRILGSPRRTSKRRFEEVGGALVDRATGESLSGPYPADSGQHSQFKPGPAARRPQSPDQAPAGQQPPAVPQPQSGRPQSGQPQSGQPGQGFVGSQPGPAQQGQYSQQGQGYQPQQGYPGQPGQQQYGQQAYGSQQNPYQQVQQGQPIQQGQYPPQNGQPNQPGYPAQQYGQQFGQPQQGQPQGQPNTGGQSQQAQSQPNTGGQPQQNPQQGQPNTGGQAAPDTDGQFPSRRDLRNGNRP